MSDTQHVLQISDISGFSNKIAWVVYKQKARIFAIIIWILVIYIFAIWVDRSLVNYNKYNGSQHHLLLIDIFLVFTFAQFVLPYMKLTNNKFSGIKEMDRQLFSIDREQARLDAEEECDIDCYKQRNDELKKQLKERDERIASLTS